MIERTIFGTVRAMRFGRLWLLNDGSVRYWTSEEAMELADDPKYADDELDGYSLWCAATVARGYQDGYGILDSLPADLSGLAIELEGKIEAAGGYGYAALLSA